MSKIMKGIMTGCTAVVATIVLPVAGVAGTITVGGALVSGGVGFIAGVVTNDSKKSDKLSEGTDKEAKVKERELTIIDYKVRRALLGEMSACVSDKSDVVYEMFNYVYSEIELLTDHEDAVLDRKLFDDNMLDVEFRYNYDKNDYEHAKSRSKGIEFIINLIDGRFINGASKAISADDMDILNDSIEVIKMNFDC